MRSRVGVLALACLALLALACSSGGSAAASLRPPVSLYLLPNGKSLPQGVHLWEAHLFPNESELIFLDRSACEGGHELHLFVNGRPPGVPPRPYRAPSAITNVGGVCDYGAGSRPSGSVDNYQGSSISWSGPAGIVNVSGSIDRGVLTRFVRGLQSVGTSLWIAYARQAPHRSSQGDVLGPNA